MNEQEFKGQWKILRGKVREQWGKVTDDDVEIIDGRSEQLIGLLQKRYGIMQEEAEKRLQEFLQGQSPDRENRKAA